MKFPETVIFWGAGATVDLGIRMTAQQAQSICALGSLENCGSQLRKRVEKALGSDVVPPLVDAITDMLTILGDIQEGGEFPIAITQAEIDAMRRNWERAATDNDLRGRILELRSLYDWPALKAVIQVCPGVATNNFDLKDLFNLLEVHSQDTHGFRMRTDIFLTPQRIIGALGALKLLLHTLFYVDWTSAIWMNKRKQQLQYHLEFAKMLARIMQRGGIEVASERKFDSREFYMGNFAVVSLNYDPLGLWFQYVANRYLNGSRTVPHVGNPRRKLQIYNDLGQFIAAQRIRVHGNTQLPWFPMNETAVQRLNEKSDGTGEVIRISKFLFPHGCVCWRECPDCGKLSSYMGNEWSATSLTLVPPPPLRAFTEGVAFEFRGNRERKEWDKGAVDARECLYCGTLIYAHHTQTIMQTNFKKAPPPVLEEIQRDMRVLVQNARHIVLMGYSLPPDDALYRAFFSARQQRKSDSGAVRCSVVVGKDPKYRRWLGPPELTARLDDIEPREAPRSTLEAARDIFGEENVRFYGGGVPDVFMEGGQVTEAAVDCLLNWN